MTEKTEAAAKKKKTSPAAQRLKDIVAKTYEEAWEAKKRGEPVGWSTSKFPAELAAAFDLCIVYPENIGAAIAAQHDGERMLTAAEEMGFDADICAYARINFAYASGIETKSSKHMPQPDFVLCCNNGCNCFTKWYETLARMKNIPMVMIDIPYHNTVGVDEGQVNYIKAQFDEAISQLEEISGKKFDEKKFEEACAVANRNSRLWHKVCDYCQHKPAPLSGFDLLNHMADMVTARCRPEVGDAFEELILEYEENLKNNDSTLPFPEEYRIMFEGIPCWPHLKAIFKPLKENGINVTAVVYAPAFGFEYRDMDEMVQVYCKTAGAVCIEEGTEWREGICRDNQVDGILVHYNRSCKAWSGYMPEMQRRWQNSLGVPVIAFDGDQADPRNFTAANYETRAQALAEAMAAAKAKKEGR